MRISDSDNPDEIGFLHALFEDDVIITKKTFKERIM